VRHRIVYPVKIPIIASKSTISSSIVAPALLISFSDTILLFLHVRITVIHVLI